MADRKISDFAPLTAVDMSDTDLLPVVDVSAGTTAAGNRKASIAELRVRMQGALPADLAQLQASLKPIATSGSAGDLTETSSRKVMTGAERAKLEGVETGAQANTISSVNGKTGMVSLGKDDIGLAAADNTADADKPVSGPQAAALAEKLSTDTYDAFMPAMQVNPRMIPLDMDHTGRLAVWLNDGNLDARGMARGLRDKATADIAPRIRSKGIVPLDLVGGRIATWLDPQRGFRAVGLDARQAAFEAQAARLFALRSQPYHADAPLATDGRTLHRALGKIARIRAGDATARLRIAMTGDSWSELATIPAALLDLLTDRLVPASGSFVQANNQYLWPGVTLAASAGWTRQDASINSDWPYGTGPDGQVYHTTGAGETITVTGVTGASIRLYTRAWGASWTWSLDGGAAVPVVEAEDGGALTVTEIGGLGAGPHTLVIAKTGGAGRLVFCGLRNVPSAQIELMKVGNSGLTGFRLRDYAALVGDIWADLDPDLVLVNLGTNDYRNGITPPSTYLDGISALTTMLRGSVPGVGVIHAMPPQTDGVAITPLSAYRDALYPWCLDQGVEMLNLLDCWGDYDPALFADTLHVNPSGAALVAHHLNHKFLGV